MPVIITKCSQAKMRTFLHLRDAGFDVKRISERYICDVNYQTLLRYFRIHDRYGIEAFIPRAVIKYKKGEAA